MIHTHCLNCHKQLKNPVYQKIGYGAICLSKLHEEGEGLDFETEEQEISFEQYKKAKNKLVYCNKDKIYTPSSFCNGSCKGFTEFGSHCLHRYNSPKKKK